MHIQLKLYIIVATCARGCTYMGIIKIYGDYQDNMGIMGIIKIIWGLWGLSRYMGIIEIEIIKHANDIQIACMHISHT